MRTLLVVLLAAVASTACNPSEPAGSAPAAATGAALVPPVASGPGTGALPSLADVHGGTDPATVAGYRMGQRALALLGLPRLSRDLDVTQRGPLQPRYTGAVDGAAAATGASLGQMNLRLEGADRGSLALVFLRRSTGQSITLRPTASFAQRFLDEPSGGPTAGGDEAMRLSDEEIFEVAPPPAPPAVSAAPVASAPPPAPARVAPLPYRPVSSAEPRRRAGDWW